MQSELERQLGRNSKNRDKMLHLDLKHLEKLKAHKDGKLNTGTGRNMFEYLHPEGLTKNASKELQRVGSKNGS